MTFKIKTIEIREPELSYPDVDTDFGTNFKTGLGRDDIIDYLVNKYGRDYVALVGNRMIYAGKSAIRDLSQVYDIDAKEYQEASKEFNNELNVEENISNSPKVEEFFNNYPELKEKVDRVVGTVSSLGIHAGGVILSDPVRGYNLRRYCALQRPSEEKRIATLWTKKEVEQLGLIKYDILGLSSASQIHYAKELIGADPYKDFKEEDEVFKDIVFNKKHKNIFQFETHVGRQAFEDLIPMSIMELANASGLIRIVGSEEGRQIYNTYKDNIDAYQRGETHEWKDNLREQVFEDKNYEIAERVLSESYGVLIYQEQLAYLIVGFSDGEKNFIDGNKVRKLLDKLGDTGKLSEKQGNREALKKWHDTFMEVMNEYVLPYIGKDGWDCPNKDVQDFLNFKLTRDNILPTPKYGIISWMISSAAYLFSKLHAIAYSINTYNMMYLKYHYPLQFWTASLVCSQSDLDKVKNYITAIQAEEDWIKILPPDVNESEFEFTMKEVEDPEEPDLIRYGLGSIMNLGKSAEVIINERRKNGSYKSVKDFIDRVPARTVNKRVIENLLYVGAFNEFGSMEDCYQEIIKAGKDIVEPDYNEDTLALKEAQLLGVNIRFKHPLVESAKYYTPVVEFEDGMNGQVAVRVLKLLNKTTKNDKPYIMAQCQCLNSNEQFNIFDWGNGKTFQMTVGMMVVLNVGKSNNFFTLKMDSRKRW